VPIRRTDPDSAATADRFSDADPRVSGDRTRTVTGPHGAVTLVGAVHDHPASVHRARTTVADRSPDVLALELPPLALPLFETLASDDDHAATGGEMSAAIAAASTARVEAIDGPSVGYVRTLARTLASERPAPRTLRNVLAGAATAGREALRCRIGAVRAAYTAHSPSVRDSVAHDCDPGDDPETQAADEARQIERARAVMDAFEPSRAARFRDETREAHMTDRLRRLRRDGDVVAVVGHGHLDAIHGRLTAGTE